MNYKIKLIYRIISVYLISFIIILGSLFAFSLIPSENNYKIVAITSGSMGRALPPNSLAVVIPQRSYKKDDIVTYKTANRNILTHRIISIENNLYLTKGDKNNDADGSRASKDNIIGKVVFSISYIGKPLLYAKTLPGLILLVIIPGTIIIYEEIKKMISLLRIKSK